MDKPLKIVQRWARTISTRNVDKMTNFYSEKAILLATFDPFLQGKKEIRNYFVDFLNKEGLRCEITENVNFIDRMSEYATCSGLYTFTFEERGIDVEVDARYTYVVYKGQIITHHSSIEPIE
tara:strand:- start:1784 stop:2149 length:366 start_codon:yes stop_codon:yes gene_type:complete